MSKSKEILRSIAAVVVIGGGVGACVAHPRNEREPINSENPKMIYEKPFEEDKPKIILPPSLNSSNTEESNEQILRRGGLWKTTSSEEIDEETMKRGFGGRLSVGLSSPLIETLVFKKEQYPFFLWDVRDPQKISPVIWEKMKDAEQDPSKSFILEGKKFILDDFGGVYGITETPGIYAFTGLSVMPDEVSPGLFVYVSGTRYFWQNGGVVVEIANANPGHDRIEKWWTANGFDYVRIE